MVTFWLPPVDVPPGEVVVWEDVVPGEEEHPISVTKRIEITAKARTLGRLKFFFIAPSFKGRCHSTTCLSKYSNQSSAETTPVV
jgi:hypothetical protein